MCVCLSRQAVQELRAKAVQRQAEDEAWYTQQEILQQAEEKRRDILQQEESKLAEQRTRSENRQTVIYVCQFITTSIIQVA